MPGLSFWLQNFANLDKMFSFCYLHTRKEGDHIKKFFLFVMVLVLALPLFLSPVSAAQVTDFTDVNRGDWFYDPVSFVVSKGMFQGSSATTFSPGETMTRGMFVTVLGRFGGAPIQSSVESIGVITKTDVNLRSAPASKNTSVLAVLQKGAQMVVTDTVKDLYETDIFWHRVSYKGQTGYIREDLMDVRKAGFTDVSPDAYYHPYVLWAYSSGIASSTGEGTFSPERPITREEISSMLYQYASLKYYQLHPVRSAISFTDAGQISAGYSTAVSTMQKAGILEGYEDGSFRPRQSASRAEVSALLSRFISAITYKKVTEPSVDSAGNYIFGTELPEKSAAPTSYFDDACFIGHSLVNGMKNAFPLSSERVFAVDGASSRSITTYSKFPIQRSQGADPSLPSTGTLAEALAVRKFNNVYIMFGVNEIGTAAYHRQTFASNMTALVQLVRQSQPTAQIYLLSLSPVSQSCSESRENVNRDNILNFNTALKQVAKEQKVYYLNLFDLLCDENGFLPSRFSSSDGLHLPSAAYGEIKKYLLSHTV